MNEFKVFNTEVIPVYLTDQGEQVVYGRILQEYLGLYEAVQHFKPEEGAKFSTYALDWIRQSIRRYLDTCGRVLRIPAQEPALYYQYGRFCEFIEKREGRLPTDAEIQGYLHISERRLQSIRKHSQEVMSLEAPLYDALTLQIPLPIQQTLMKG